MRLYILPDDFSGQNQLEISGEKNHYLCHVLRKKVGDSFPGLDKEGVEWQISITEIKEASCIISLEKLINKRVNKTEITLVQCIPKGKKMDLIIRQAVEAGIKRIIPVTSEHSVPRFENNKDRDKKIDRWKKIAIEAMQQSGSRQLLKINKIIPMSKVPELLKSNGIGLFCHQERIDQNSLHQYLNETPVEVFIVIGPEGGLSPDEINLLDRKGFNPVYLGDTILRTETAALYATAAVNVILLEKNKWSLNK